MPLVQRRLLTFCPKLQRHHCLACVLSASEQRSSPLCVSLSGKPFLDPTFHLGQPLGSEPPHPPQHACPSPFACPARCPGRPGALPVAWPAHCCSLPGWSQTRRAGTQSLVVAILQAGTPGQGGLERKNSRVSVLTGAAQVDPRRGGSCRAVVGRGGDGSG